MSNVAVIDIGKTNAKLALVDRQSLTEIAVVTRPNTVIDAPPWPHFDIEGHWTFLLEALAGFHADHGIAEISITTHGASITLIDANGDLAAPMLDYEHTGPDDLAAEYDAIRPPFSETGSARLSMGLNVGAQLYWQFKTDPSLAARTARVLTYPQFWAFRLTGIAATEVTSLGCHTDLWNPHAKTPSSLAARLGIDQKLAPVRPADEALGPIHPTIARQTGLDPATPVRCGIH
ncbi:MAG: FGGY family carbohydrate kinase, partial [Pseudomonadota bacterium]